MTTQRDIQIPPIPDDYASPRRVSDEEYHRLEALLPGKHEYHNGLMYPRFYPPDSHWAMAGGTAAHDQIIVRLIVGLSLHLGNRGPCRVHTSDMKLVVGTREYYPDVHVACDESARANLLKNVDASIVCEVRSQSTADFDMSEKFEAYKQLPSIREYLILDNRRPEATLFRKDADALWRQRVFSVGTAISLESIGCTLPLAQLYDGVILDPDPMH